jgi:hypothetical protein
MVTAVALFLVAIGVLIALQSGTSIFAGQVEAQADRAQFLAETGIEDALMKVARDKTYTQSYTITETDGTIAVNVASGPPVVITATSTVVRNQTTVQRTMQAQVTLDADGVITGVAKSNL